MSARAWVLLDIDQRCGRCGTIIPARAWFVEVRVPGMTRVLVRCEACAKADDLVRPDWKARAAGDA